MLPFNASGPAALAFLLLGVFADEGHRAGDVPLSGPGDSRQFAIVDFAPVAEIKGDIKRQYILRVYAEDGAGLSLNLPFVAQLELANVLCTSEEASLRRYNWSYTRKGDRLAITSHTDDKGRKWPITKITITGVKNLAPGELPTIVASDKVEVQWGDK